LADYTPTFTGSIPEHYDRHLVPIVFAPYAKDLASRLRYKPKRQILELACGTGAVTRELLDAISIDAELMVTDFSPAMLAYARESIEDEFGPIASSGVDWQIADAGNLPFEDRRFDYVVCQFGVMFFPDKPAAMREALRVLVPGGKLIFIVWGAMKDNPVFEAAELALRAAFPEESVPILPTPCSMSDEDQLRRLVVDAGFCEPEITFLEFRATGYAASQVASGFIYGTPISAFVAEKGRLPEEMHARIEEKARELMGDPIDAIMIAIVCEATAPAG
jgi:ubiquinone/menaquinone biosynthesis C-methylase UbiE